MARRLIVEIVGDASSLERSFKRSQRATRGFGKDMERAGRGAVVASVGFRGLGRSVAFASGAFLGGAGLAAAIRSTLSAAAESQRVQSQLTNVLQKQGLATRANVAAIDARTTALSQMSGFDDELATQTFVNLLRVTGNVTKSLRDNAIAADVARGRNIGLDAAAKLVTKAELGQAGALRRVGIAAKDGASSVELLDLLQRKFAGSAEAYGKTAAGAQDRFAVAVENTQEAIGQALLPSLTKLLNRATDWLNKQENQKRIQEGVNDAVDKGTTVATGLARGFDALRSATNFVRGADPFGGKSLKELSSFGRNRSLDPLIAQFNELRAAQKGVADGYKSIEDARRGAFAGGATGGRSVAGVLPSSVRGSSFVGRPLTQREQLAIALGANPDDVGALRGQRGLDQKALDFALQQIRERKGNTAKFAQAAANLSSDIAAINQRLAGIASEKAQKAKDAAARIRAANEKARQSILDAIGAAHGGTATAPGAFATAQGRFRAPLLSGAGPAAPGVLQAAQFHALGLTATGQELAPTAKALRSQLAKVKTAIAGTILDTDPNRHLLEGARQVLNRKFGQLNDDVARRMEELFDTLLGNKRTGPLTPGHALDVSSITRGLTRAQAKLVQERLSVAHIVTGPGRGGGVTVVVHHETRLDEKVLERSVTTHQTRRGQRTPTQTRGRQAK